MTTIGEKPRFNLARVQQDIQSLYAELHRCLASANEKRNGGHMVDRFVLQAARLNKQIRNAEARLARLARLKAANAALAPSSPAGLHQILSEK